MSVPSTTLVKRRIALRGNGHMSRLSQQCSTLLILCHSWCTYNTQAVSHQHPLRTHNTSSTVSKVSEETRKTDASKMNNSEHSTSPNNTCFVSLTFIVHRSVSLLLILFDYVLYFRNQFYHFWKTTHLHTTSVETENNKRTIGEKQQTRSNPALSTLFIFAMCEVVSFSIWHLLSAICFVSIGHLATRQ